jgi:4-amino-4-deoxy-L-arabinose transferase-like glycosyltransferase
MRPKSWPSEGFISEKFVARRRRGLPPSVRVATVRRTPRRWLIIVVALAALLRAVPIWFGLPYAYSRPDEEVAVGHALNVLDGTYNPEFFEWPSVTFYLFAASFRLASAVSQTVGLGQPGYLTNLVIARAIVAAAGTATVVLVYLLARRFNDTATALTAALFVAVAPLHVRDSHFAMTDVLATLFVVWSLLLLLHAMDTRLLTRFAAAGIIGGLAASTKYSAGAVVGSIAAVQLILLRGLADRWREAGRWLPSFVFIVAGVGGFLLGTPYALLDRAAFLKGITHDLTHLTEGHNGLQAGIGWTYHVTRSLPAAMSWPLFLSGLIGIVPLIRHHQRPAAVIGGFCLVLYVSLGFGHTLFFRYILPLVPFLCVSAAVAVRWKRVPLLPLVVAVPALVTSVWSDILLARPDTRLLATQWLVDHVKPGESLYQAGSHYSDVPLGPLSPQTWPREIFDAASGAFAGGGLPEWLIIPQSPLGLYTTVPASLNRIASERYSIAHRVRATPPDKPDPGVYDPADAFFLPVTGFDAILRPGPTIVIYRRIASR